jgi:GT2 family glycosyltransferase
VIVFFRSEDVLVDCIRSVVAQTVRPQAVAVAANSAVPAAMARELEAMGAVVVGHEATTNTGFAAACNRGAAALDVEYLWFVNPDVWCEPDCLEHLLRWATENLVLAPPCPAKRRSYLSPRVLLARFCWDG